MVHVGLCLALNGRHLQGQSLEQVKTFDNALNFLLIGAHMDRELFDFLLKIMVRKHNEAASGDHELRTMI